MKTSNYVLIFCTAFPFGRHVKNQLIKTNCINEIYKIKDGNLDPETNFIYNSIAEINNIDENKLEEINELIRKMEDNKYMWSLLFEVPPKAEK